VSAHPLPENRLLGHSARWAALARAFASGNIPQSLLLSGPPQIGKWTLALRYAQLLLCPSPIEENGWPAPCGHCKVCHQVKIETFPDFKVYRPLVSSVEDERDWVIAPKMMSGSILPIHVARKFGNEAMRKPLVGPRKVMVIVQADRMNDEAQNALLKTFEEPVNGLSIFLLCDNADQLRATIRSRCWHVPLGLASDGEITDWLQATGADAAQIDQAVKTAAGRPGVAKREIERLMAAQNEEEGQPLVSRQQQAEAFLRRLEKSSPVGALGFTEEALLLGKQWWDEDQSVGAATTGKKELKKGDAKVVRSSVALFLDELASVYRARWIGDVTSSKAVRWSDGLDQIRKTRQYILRNANTNLALDVLFGHLISGQSQRLPERIAR